MEAVDAMVCEQIKIVGSKNLDERIDRSFKEGSMEPYFLKEQWMLFSWREILPVVIDPKPWYNYIIVQVRGWTMAVRMRAQLPRPVPAQHGEHL